MATLPDNCIDTILTDPPYDLTGKSGSGGFMGKSWDASGIAFNPDVWRECLRVAKPGATLMAFGGDRTHHRLMVAIEDAGWEIRTCIYWIFGSGFPKSLPVRKSLERQFSADALCVCDQNSRQIIRDFQSDYPECCHSGDEQLLLDQDTVQDVLPSQVDVLACSRDDHNRDDLCSEQANTCPDGASAHPSNGDCLFHNAPQLTRSQENDNILSDNPLNRSPSLQTEIHKMDSRKSDKSNSVYDSASFSSLNTPFNETVDNALDTNIPQCSKCGKLKTAIWEGYGTALKPAAEIIVVAMKPIDGTFAANAEKWGVAGLNIDGGRVEAEQSYADKGIRLPSNKASTCYGQTKGKDDDWHKFPGNPQGRYPANLIHDGSDEVLAEFDKAGVSGGSKPIQRPEGFRRFNGTDYNNGKEYNTSAYESPGYEDSGSAARFFQQCPPDPTDHPDAARFHYCPKAPQSERQTPRNNHPTQKPLSLMRYLCKLTKTPTGGVVLDPFGGSGTTGLAAIAEGRDYIIIEKEPEYCQIIRRRIAEYTGEEIAPKEIKVTEDQTAKQMSLW
jgi:DNA modification methylase